MEELTTETYDKQSLREAFGEALVEAGHRYDDIRVLDAGTKNSTYSQKFEQIFPDKFITPGINEPGMMGLAAGMAMAGKRIVAADMSVFLHHAYAQIRTAARQGDDLHLIIGASHTGIAVGPDGGSAHDLTDLARMRLIPNFTVVTPWDGAHVKKAMETMLQKKGYYYIRLNRPKVPLFLKEPIEFEIGKAYKLREGNNVTLIAAGDMVYKALLAADELGEGFAEVIGISTLEPLDTETILESASKTGRVVTAEDHMYIGGLFESIAGVLALNNPVPMRKVALDRQFTTSGDPDDLAELYGITKSNIMETCRKIAESKAGMHRQK